MFPKAPLSVYQSPKCFVTHGSMGHIDSKQVPHKSKPWANLAQLDFIHKVDVLFPPEFSATVRRELIQNHPPPRYSKLKMSLEQVLERDFLTAFIKKGNVLMQSEGSTAFDSMFTLKEGILTMYLDKETYERAGLVGRPYGPRNHRGFASRWVVQYDLRSPSMLHGKKGFDRLVYAAKQVLNKPVTWLFCDVDESESTLEPLEKHSHADFTASPGTVEGLEVRNVPLEISSLASSEGDRFQMETEATELYEWLSLVRLESPRIDANDKVDPYLSKYESPHAPATSMKLDKLSWEGFISPKWLRETLASLLIHSPSKTWFALSASELCRNAPNSGNEVLLLRPCQAAEHYIMWEIKNHA